MRTQNRLISVADPDPGFDTFLTPIRVLGWVKNQDPDS
jgi:hypothetical protein